MYRPGHSTETALVQLLDSIYHAADHGKATLRFSLDLSAAFDTIDHPILLHRLAHSFGITGSVFTWVQSYLSGRSQIVRLGSHSSNPHLVSLAYPRARSLDNFYSPFTYLWSPTLQKPTIYNTIMLMTRNCSWLSPQVMCMLKYPLSNLVCHHCKPGSVQMVWFWIQINPTQSYLAPLNELSCYLIRSLLISHDSVLREM